MNAYLKNLSVALLALSLCFSFSHTLHLTFAKSSTQLGSRYAVPQEEIDADDNITKLTASYSAVGGYTVYNWYGADTTINNIYEAAYGAGHTYSISFYIGHGNVRTVYLIENHYDIMTDDGTWVPDDWIYPHSECQNVRFVFMWSCHLGDTIDGTHFWSGPYGMPHCWLHTTDLSSDGYADSDDGGKAFLGFAGFIWGLSDYLAGDEVYEFLSCFYFASLCYGASYSVNDALDYAAQNVWHVPSFADTYLYKGYNYTYWDPEKMEMVTIYGQMKVYGDGNIHISNFRPSCAMKTGTDGVFYVPNVAISLLKIEMLFNNSDIVGDQTGGTSPYSTISEWPDGKVDLTDILFVSLHYGTTEGMSDWDYMSDIVPDGKCDMADYLAVSLNFGAFGTYIEVTGVTVTFNVGGSKSPDSYGFVEIPQDATSFTVKRNGIPIGAMVIFW